MITESLASAILGKPADAAEAEAMLQRLSGRPHRVYTAVAVHDGRRIHATGSSEHEAVTRLLHASLTTRTPDT
jgi:septum formation protein